MSIEYKLPDLGENIEGGEVIGILVAPGDTVSIDQPLFELETDKAVIEVPSSVAGTVGQLHVETGATVTVGQLLITFEDAPDSAAASTVAETEAESKTEPKTGAETEAESKTETEGEQVAKPTQSNGPVSFNLPDLGENIEGGTVIGILVAPGDTASIDQPLFELETDKAVIEVPSAVAGTVTQIHVEEGAAVTVGQLLITFEAAAQDPANQSPATTVSEVPTPQATTPQEPTATPTPAAAPAPAPAPTASGKLVPAAPSVRRLAREIGVDITQVTGSGPGGRISQNDVKAHARQLNTSEKTASATPGPTMELPDFSQWGNIDAQPMSNVRRVTAERLSYAWATIPHVTQFDKSDTTDLEKWRKQFGPRVEAAGAKLTPTAILLKVVAAALKAFPQFNASIDMAKRQIIYKQYCHIGVAVDTDRGLLVPVLRDVDRKNITELAVELGEISQKARSRKLGPNDMQGGCFTISNLGGIGGTGFSPIVNPPEVAILGVARSAHEPVLIEGQFQPRLMMPLSLSYDHRIIDGANGARFLRWIAEALENPFLLVLEG
ncbi:MAG: dihydrolipoyllysine-residue acetyltransferase [Candidatus Latescibacteria bacterium]|nr:dihydrolipoyllysine-residue acetyltransferase [Candidatus Latescibacterota bacterium]